MLSMTHGERSTALMARVFRNAWFRKFARRQRIEDEALCAAVRRIEAGLVDADLGGGLIKQRVARPGGADRGVTGPSSRSERPHAPSSSSGSLRARWVTSNPMTRKI